MIGINKTIVIGRGAGKKLENKEEKEEKREGKELSDEGEKR